MKTLISISFLFLALPAFSATTLFYTGEAISTKGTSVERHRYLLARTSDEQKNTIEEKVVSFQRDHYKENASVMKIDGNNFSMTEDTKTITGNGEFTGLPWQWTFLRAEFSMTTLQFKMRIVDYNFLGDETTIAGHKDFYMTMANAPENMFMQEDVFLLLTDEQSYLDEKSKLLN